MSEVLTAKRICEEALGAIGAFPVTESAADGEQLRRAMTWLDLIMAETSGTEKIFALIPATLSVPLTNGTDEYDLEATLGADLPLDSIQAPVQAWLEDASENRTPLTIVTRKTFEDAKTLAGAPTEGTPTMIYIDRLAVTPMLRTFPKIASTDPNTWTVKLDVQSYAPNVAPGGVTGTQPSGSILTKFRVAWQRWLILQLSHDLGSGPIFKLSVSRLDNLAKKAGTALTKLLAFENQEHDDETPIGSSSESYEYN